MASWPSTLPDFVLRQGYSEKLPNVLIRSQTDTGPAKVRRRHTTGVREFNIVLSLTPDEADDFDEFFITTLKHGSLTFTWVNPRTQVSSELRFKEAPSLTPDGANYFANFTLELLP